VNLAVIAVIVVPAVLGVAGLLIVVSGLGVWGQAHRLSREHQGGMSLFSQKSPQLEQALTSLGRAADRSGFYYLLFVDSEALHLYLGGQLVISAPISQVRGCRVSTTLVRGLDLPCVMVTLEEHGIGVELPIQAAGTPWAALVPTSPSRASKFSERLRRHIGAAAAG